MSFFLNLFLPPAPKGSAPYKSLKRSWKEIQTIPDDYIVIDVETSGLDACFCEILEIGAIKYRNGAEIDRFHSYIRPEGAIPCEVSNINGITWRKVHNAPRLDDIRIAFLAFLGDDVLVGHNVGFDIKFIQTRFDLLLNNFYFDTLSWSKIAFPHLSKYQLDYMRKAYSLGGLAHTALGDCEATHNLFLLISKSDYTKQELSRLAQQVEEQDKFYAQLRQQRAEAKAKKDAFMINGPSRAELQSISSKMIGTASDYLTVAKRILSNHGHSLVKVQEFLPNHGIGTLKHNWNLFFSVKTTGQLKYILLSVPPEEIHCSFPVTPSSLTEGENFSRIFIGSPSDLEDIADYIIKAYLATAPYFKD